MTVKETIEMYKGKYDLVEIYAGDGLHTDSYDSYEPEQVKDYKAESWALMNCEDEKILCILISRKSIEMGEEYGRTAAKEQNMTVKETIEMYKGKYDLVEIYVGDRLHTDYCDYYEPEQGADYEAKSWALMNCEDYNNSILANTGTTTDDFGWKNEKILCILISRESIAQKNWNSELKVACCSEE